MADSVEKGRLWLHKTAAHLERERDGVGPQKVAGVRGRFKHDRNPKAGQFVR